MKPLTSQIPRQKTISTTLANADAEKLSETVRYSNLVNHWGIPNLQTPVNHRVTRKKPSHPQKKNPAGI